MVFRVFLGFENSKTHFQISKEKVKFKEDFKKCISGYDVPYFNYSIYIFQYNSPKIFVD